MRRPVLLSLGLAVVSVVVLWQQAVAVERTWDELRAYYDYDPSVPLDAVAGPPRDGGLFTIETIRFKSVNDQVVPAALRKPKNAERPPVILCLHGLGGNKDDVALGLALLVCPQGIAVLSLDAQYHGERRVPDGELVSPDVDRMIAGFRQTIIDYRRALDYVATREDLDHERVVLVGASMGAIMGSILTAVEPRIRAAFLIVGGGDLIGLFQNSQIGNAAEIRQQIGDLEQYREAVAWIEPTLFVGHIAPRALWMVNGRDDQIVPAANGQALFDAAGEPKFIEWYHGGLGMGHAPPVDVLVRRLQEFLLSEGFITPRAQPAPVQ